MLSDYNSDHTYNGSGRIRNVNHTFHKEWHQFKYTNLRSGEDGYYVGDVDSMFMGLCDLEGAFHHDLDGNLLLLERKCYLQEPRQNQRRLFYMLDYALRQTYNERNQPVRIRLGSGEWKTVNVTYHGYHLLQFKTTKIADGELFLDHQPITVSQLVDFLHFKTLT